MEGFLPEDYKAPDNSNYMKWQDGENVFRILSSAIVGYEYWNDQEKPIRNIKPWERIPADIRTDKNGNPEKIKHFWAFVVWNYAAEKIQILQVNQKTVQTQIKTIVDNKRWGNPKMYDITVTRSGSGFDTEYFVQANPPISLPDRDILQALKNTPVDLEALFTGNDPFGQLQEEEQPKAQIKRPTARPAVQARQAVRRTPADVVQQAGVKSLVERALEKARPNPLMEPGEEEAMEVGNSANVISEEENQALADELGF